MTVGNINFDYAEDKLGLLLRDLKQRNYTKEEFWRQMSRITEGATGLPSAEDLLKDCRYLVDAYGRTDEFAQMTTFSVPDEFVVAALHESNLDTI